MTILPSLVEKTPTKIVFLIMDGVGGMAGYQGGPSALEAAAKPNLDALAAESVCGRHVPLFHGITPGSGPSHLSLFGYDPFRFEVGRGVVEGLGLGLDLQSEDVAARGNFATIDEEGIITDRRAGRISTERCKELCEQLQEDICSIEDVTVTITHGEEHRFVVVFHGGGLGPDVSDTDPQKPGHPPLEAKPLHKDSAKTARVANAFIARARELLASHHPANMVMLRGFSKRPSISTMTGLFKLTPAAFATYPLYRGVARLIGMSIIKDMDPHISVEEQFRIVEKYYQGDCDFFFIHVKRTDSFGEDGNVKGKARVIEEVDRALPIIRALQPDVLLITGDHSTPWPLKSHSWHSVPFLLRSPYCEPDGVREFTEKACGEGRLGGLFPALSLLPYAMANALKLKKFGA